MAPQPHKLVWCDIILNFMAHVGIKATDRVVSSSLMPASIVEIRVEDENTICLGIDEIIFSIG